jgi:hypothetical protein
VTGRFYFFTASFMDKRELHLNSQLELLRGLEIVDAFMDMESEIDELLGVPTLIVSNAEHRLVLRILSDDEGNSGGSFVLEEDRWERVPLPHRLPKVMLGEKSYFLDDRLRELRNVVNPHDRISLRLA